MTERELLIYLHLMKGVGWKTISKLYQHLDRIQDIFVLNALEISVRSGVEFSLAEFIKSQCMDEKTHGFMQLLQQWQNNRIEIITFIDKQYPTYLKEIAQPPWVLFFKGNIHLLQQPLIAIVGTRYPTNYGKMVAEKLARELTEYKIGIVSGMARGLDRVAHESTLTNDGSTIAVLGSGIDVIYPKEHKQLYELIRNKGLIISEYPPGTQPHPGYFPQRNRIISGLALGTIVVEASEKSGSLITAQFALEQSREVFAVPGPIHSKQSIGTNALIQQGAKLVRSAEDIIEEFSFLNIIEGKKIMTEDSLTNYEQKVYESIKNEPVNINDIYNQIDLNMSDIYEVLLSLQLKGKIKQVPGGKYLRHI